MLKLYGIKSCDSVKRAMKYLGSRGIEHEFVDFKRFKVDDKIVDSWLKIVSIDKLFNQRGTTYKRLGLKSLNLDSGGKREWIIKENMLIKRPVIEYDFGENRGVIVGYSEDEYDRSIK